MWLQRDGQRAKLLMLLLWAGRVDAEVCVQIRAEDPAIETRRFVEMAAGGWVGGWLGGWLGGWVGGWVSESCAFLLQASDSARATQSTAHRLKQCFGINFGQIGSTRISSRRCALHRCRWWRSQPCHWGGA